MKIRYLLASCVLASLVISNQAVMAGSGHGHNDHRQDYHDEEAVEKEGPNGGKLLEKGEYAIEITIFESGIPPEMRVYAYKNDQLLKPEQVEDLVITLSRLGGDKDVLRFRPEQDYLVGDQVIVEPHSYDVAIEAAFADEHAHWQYQSHEGRAEISDRLLKLVDVKTEPAGPQTLRFVETLFGVVDIPQDKRFRVFARYNGMVENIHVNVGDKVKKGQTVATILNSQTLQRYNVKSPAEGEVIHRIANPGDKAIDKALLEIADLSEVWVEMSAFPESIEKLRLGQTLVVRDLHQHEMAEGKVTYISPVMTGGHIARARSVIDNKEGHWRPGMHIKADIEVSQRKVELAVKNTALQNFREMPVVFVRYGNTFEVRMLEMGETDGQYIEVLGGLKPETDYVTENSFLLKADVLKDGASHDH